LRDPSWPADIIPRWRHKGSFADLLFVLVVDSGGQLSGLLPENRIPALRPRPHARFSAAPPWQNGWWRFRHGKSEGSVLESAVFGRPSDYELMPPTFIMAGKKERIKVERRRGGGNRVEWRGRQNAPPSPTHFHFFRPYVGTTPLSGLIGHPPRPPAFLLDISFFYSLAPRGIIQHGQRAHKFARRWDRPEHRPDQQLPDSCPRMFLDALGGNYLSSPQGENACKPTTQQDRSSQFPPPLPQSF